MQENNGSIAEKVIEIQSENYKKQQELHKTMEFVRNYEQDLSNKVKSIEILETEVENLEKELQTKTNEYEKMVKDLSLLKNKNDNTVMNYEKLMHLAIKNSKMMELKRSAVSFQEDNLNGRSILENECLKAANYSADMAKRRAERSEITAIVREMLDKMKSTNNYSKRTSNKNEDFATLLKESMCSNNKDYTDMFVRLKKTYEKPVGCFGKLFRKNRKRTLDMINEILDLRAQLKIIQQ